MRIVQRRDVFPAQWDDFVHKHPEGWFFHRGTWLHYCVAYHLGAADLSFVIEHNGEILALVPLIREDDRFTMGGHPGAAPLYADMGDTATQAYARATVAELGARHLVTSWQTRSLPRPSPVNATLDSWQTFVMDLRQDDATLWRNCRRSYHGLIHRAERAYTIVVERTPEAVAIAHAIHRAAARRETRAQATWDLMAEWATAGNLLIGMARAPSTGSRGMAMAIRYKDRAYYASSAQLEKTCSHALIWTLAKALKDEGVTAFEIGWAERPVDTLKEKNIAFFKQGFGGERHTIIPTTLALA